MELVAAEAEESEAARAARLEIVAALKARKTAMDDKLKAKLDELKKLCLQEGELTGQLPVEFPLTPGEPAPIIRRRVGTSFTLPENLLNKAKSSKVPSSALLFCLFFSIPVAMISAFPQLGVKLPPVVIVLFYLFLPDRSLGDQHGSLSWG